MKTTKNFLGRVIRTQQALGHKIFIGTGEKNIVYIEGVNLDGTLNVDKMNEWNDVRLVYEVIGGDTPKLLGAWIATTEPGQKYTQSPLNPNGAFRIAFGQYKAWSVGWHKDHEALVQVGDVRGHRDKNKDGFRTGDTVVCGCGFGINQHHGYDMHKVDGASAGCLVGKTRVGHTEFVEIIKTDPRYKKDKNYVFWTSILDGSKLCD